MRLIWRIVNLRRIYTEHETDVIFKDLSISNPFGKTLIENLNLTLPKGSTLLIQGNSGVGKTTLLRTVAGLWAYSEGDVYCPTHQLFLSQNLITTR